MKTFAGSAGSLAIFIFLFFVLSCSKSSTYNTPPPTIPPTIPPPVVNKTPALQIVADSMISPIAMAEPLDSTGRIFIVEQTGKIWIIDSTGKKLATPVSDVTSKMVSVSPSYDERGLLGLAFHPGYKTNGRFYLFYSAPPKPGVTVPGGAPWNNTTTISEFKVNSSDPNVADLSSEKILVEDNHPYLNHNGGTLAFGPDGFLYISIGDGGNGDDVGNGHVSDWYTVNAGGNGQDNYANLMGDLLRIDVNSGSPYGVPTDNPFVGTAAKPEIYAFGFRNPYRFSFDMSGTHQLLVGDEGQSLYEEIDNVTKGGNYGWNVKEGTHCFNTDNDLMVRASCPSTDSAGNPLLDPVIELVNSANPAGGGVGIAVIGGYVYRGTALPALQGKYIFGMLATGNQASGKIFSADPAASGMWTWSALTLSGFTDNLGQYLKGFGQDRHGEIYLMTSANLGPAGNTGKVYKLVGI
jgi:glucose/arabinose dehydrogenase